VGRGAGGMPHKARVNIEKMALQLVTAAHSPDQLPLKAGSEYWLSTRARGLGFILNACKSPMEKRMESAMDARGALSVRDRNRMGTGTISGPQSEAIDRSAVIRVAIF
jgi:hypothetical protein